MSNIRIDGAGRLRAIPVGDAGDDLPAGGQPRGRGLEQFIELVHPEMLQDVEHGDQAIRFLGTVEEFQRLGEDGMQPERAADLDLGEVDVDAGRVLETLLAQEVEELSAAAADVEDG